ncbi:hypothetical protein, conserved [Leishmania donovani]|uniref:Uncharacterized protein n=1 Tax=Leishmania donovani TaxID=5661 RepID=E9B7U2_LEIDO|nr:hypothetical protein, conserved [Leishmania donovani]AYU75751.1 hypothetical protein LdCL_030012600 [Leishmania donovani]CBZ31315.1 hypothetical protein, conserved [Leishmania donovani]
MRQFSYRTARTATASLAANATLIPVRNCYDSSRVGRGDAAAAAASSSSPSVPYRRSSAPPRHARPVGGRGPVKDRFPPVPTDLADPRRRLAVLVDGSNPNLIPGGCTTVDQVYRTSALFTTVLPAVLQVGVPVLLRVFAHQLPAVWEPLLAGSSSSAAQGGSASASPHTPTDGAGQPISLVPLPFQPSSSASSSTADAVIVPQVQFEYFRVERFIPVAMQMEADARHLYEFRHTNKVEGVCYVCHEVDRAMYISLMEEQRTVSVELEELLREVRGKGRRTEAKEEKAAAAAFFNQYVLDELGMAGELLADSRSKNGA